MNEDEIELLKEKMCTKICQLTRVVYLLNNKYLDSQCMVNAIKESYEEEIGNLAREANEAIIQIKKKFEEQNNSAYWESKLETLTQSYENKFKEINEKFLQYKEIADQKETKLKDEYEKKYNEMIEELKKIKNNAEEKINQLKKQNEKDKNEYNDNTAKIKAEFEKFKKEAQENEEKLKEIIIEKEKIISSLEKEKENLMKENTEKTEQMSKLKLQSEKRGKDKDDLRAEIIKLQTTVAEQSERILELEEENKKLINQGKSDQVEILSLNEIKLRLTLLEKELSDKNDSLTSLSKEYQTVLKEKEELIHKLSNTTDKLRKNENELNSLKEELKQKGDVSIEKLNQLKKQYEDEKIALESKYKEEIDRIKFNNTLEINEMKLKYDSVVSNLKIENLQLKSNETKANDNSKLVAQLKKQIESQKEMNLKKEEEFKEYQMKIFQKMKDDFMDAMTLLQKKNKNLVNEIRDLEQYISMRPSKEEDIQKIDKLQRDLQIKENELSEARQLLMQFSNGNGNYNNPSSNSKIKVLNTLKINKKPKYTNASYGMIFSKK